MRSRIEPLMDFAWKLRGYLPGLPAHRRYALHTSVLEGINNEIKGIKRMAYGFRDDERFFLKIRAASAELGEEPNNCRLDGRLCAGRPTGNP
jgi:transposase